MKDGQGLEVANADASAIEALDFLREEWLAFGKRLDSFVTAAGREERCAMLPVMAANLALSMNSQEGHARGAAFMAQAQAMPRPGVREEAWLEATRAWLAGDLARSLASYETIVRNWPQDLLAGKLGQLHAFNLGDATALLRIGERLFAANPDSRHVRSMYAFALHECHRIDEAETQARMAIERERKDPLSHQVLALCLAARGRLVEGAAFLESVSETWEDCNSFMYTQNWSSLAHFAIDLDRVDAALALFDTRLRKEFSEDKSNAISLLARVELRGLDVGSRWVELTAGLERRLHDHFVPFLDLHYLYALARAGLPSAVTELLASLEDRAERASPSEREAWADCAVPAAHGLAAHVRGNFPEAARLLGQAMPHLRSIGGSIPQRALFGAIHLDALIKSDWNDAAVKILQADERERPGVPSIKRALADLYRKLGRAEQATTADYQAEQLARQYHIVRGVAA